MLRLAAVAILSRMAAAARVPGRAALRRAVHRLPAEVARSVVDMARVGCQLFAWEDGQRMELWASRGRHMVLPSRRAEVIGVEFFPTGDRLLSWDTGGHAVIWDSATGDPMLRLFPGRQILAARVFPAGDRVVACTALAPCRVWDAASGEVRTTFRRMAELIRGETSIEDLRLEPFPAGDKVDYPSFVGSRSIWNAEFRST